VTADDSVRSLAKRMRDRLEPLLDDIIAALRAEVPAYRPGEGPVEDDMRPSLRAYLVEVLAELDGTASGGAGVLDGQMRRRVEQGVALADILHSYRLGVARLWQALAALARDDPEGTRGLVTATPAVFEILDRYSLRAAEIQREITVRQARRHEQVRAALLDSVLTRDPSIGAAFWDAVAHLGIPRTGRFFAVDVRDVRDGLPGVEPPPDLEAEIARRPGVEGAWFRVGPRSQTGLLCLRSNARADTLWAPILREPTLVAGVSAGYDTVSGTPKARAQAQVAAAAVTRRRRLVQYDRDLLPVLLASAPNAAEVLVQETLGPILAQPPDRRAAILETVRAWLATAQSVAAAAERLQVHRNTVTYRLNRFQELTGRPLTDNTWLAQIVLALEADEGRDGEY
jgi:hypothetical protein